MKISQLDLKLQNTRDSAGRWIKCCQACLLRMNVRSVIGWDRSIVIYRLSMPVVLQSTMRKCLGGLSSEGKVKRRVLLSFIEISRLGPRIPKHEGSCRKAEEVLSMSTLEIFGRRPQLSGRQFYGEGG
ncbi:hypothetical protein HZH66_013692 [Vespula vulgaris]|uniref:Uncharacterized protein n=1 Tax=Vespula vulgaris TaxID=7454 RepID=A0A834MRA9_VESVU|nr:hypothetical protein HZH66_013692 [Vespula vulgaris]